MAAADGAVEPPPAGQRCLVEIAAMPSFMSPFTWRIIAQMSNAYEIHDIDLLDQPLPRAATTRIRRAVAADAALSERVDAGGPDRRRTTHLGQVFLGFSRFPAARSAVDAHGVDDGPLDRHAVRRAVRSPAAISRAPRARAVHRDVVAHRRADGQRSLTKTTARTVTTEHAAARRAHVGRGRAAARGRARGRPSLRRAADLREERQPVARPRCCRATRSASSARGSRRRASVRSSRTRSYLINLATTDPALRQQSLEAMGDELDRAEALGLLGVVLHPGCYTSAAKPTA